MTMTKTSDIYIYILGSLLQLVTLKFGDVQARYAIQCRELHGNIVVAVNGLNGN